jgi:hypothetical protein
MYVREAKIATGVLVVGEALVIDENATPLSSF